jgi:hypothetical protein
MTLCDFWEIVIKNISFPFKAQNGYGNMIFMKAYYSMKFVNGKTETTHFVN